jgi:4-carboxymuconolactone decarboxylase
LGSKLDGAVSKVIKNRQKGKGGDKKANVNAAVKMHSGGAVHDEHDK